MIGTNDGSFGDELENELGLLLHEHRREADDHEKELNMYRSGSAPPTVEGSLSAVGGLFGNNNGSNNNNNHLAFSEFAGGNGFMSEDELRADPAYLSYYYSNVNLNPRLPPPLLSKEDWRFSQRMQSGGGGGGVGLGGIGDRRKSNRTDGGGGGGSGGGGVSLFSMPPGFNSKKQEAEVSEAEKVKVSAEWGGDGLIGLPGLGLGSKQKSLAEIFQDDLTRSTTPSGHPSRPASRNTFENNDDNNTLPTSYSYAAALAASLSRSGTPDPQHIARVPSPVPTPIGGGRVEKRNLNGQNNLFNGGSSSKESEDLVTALSGMNLSNGSMGEAKNRAHFDQNPDYHDAYPSNNNNNNNSNNNSNSNNLYVDGSSNNIYGGWDPAYSNYGTTAYTTNSSQMVSGQVGNLNLPPLF